MRTPTKITTAIGLFLGAGLLEFKDQLRAEAAEAHMDYFFYQMDRTSLNLEHALFDYYRMVIYFTTKGLIKSKLNDFMDEFYDDPIIAPLSNDDANELALALVERYYDTYNFFPFDSHAPFKHLIKTAPIFTQDFLYGCCYKNGISWRSWIDWRIPDHQYRGIRDMKKNPNHPILYNPMKEWGPVEDRTKIIYEQREAALKAYIEKKGYKFSGNNARHFWGYGTNRENGSLGSACFYLEKFVDDDYIIAAMATPHSPVRL